MVHCMVEHSTHKITKFKIYTPYIQNYKNNCPNNITFDVVVGFGGVLIDYPDTPGGSSDSFPLGSRRSADSVRQYSRYRARSACPCSTYSLTASSSMNTKLFSIASYQATQYGRSNPLNLSKPSRLLAGSLYCPTPGA